MKDQQTFILGRTTFIPNFQDQILPRLHPNNVDLIVRSDHWQVTLNNSWIMILPSIKETECKYLHVMYPYSFDQAPPPVLKLVGGSSFRSLLKIQLEKNNIISVENLGSADMESLEVLSLPHNLITILKPLNKTNFPKLCKIHLGDNKCHNIDISRTRFKSTMTRLEISRSGGEVIKVEDPRILVKQLFIGCNLDKIFKEDVKGELKNRFNFDSTNWEDPNGRTND